MSSRLCREESVLRRWTVETCAVLVALNRQVVRGAVTSLPSRSGSRVVNAATDRVVLP